jgi:CheY-like chemotaxis protein
LFTKNIFIIKNNIASVKNFDVSKIIPFTEDEFQDKFLNKIKVQQPKDYLTHHSIANEWSMYRWAEYLNVNAPDIKKIRDDISSMLYFKYLQAKFPIQRSLFAKHKQQLSGNGKVLYVDDEWKKGWRSIFEHIFEENDNCHLKTVEEEYKDKTQEEIISLIMENIISFDPDVIILDMRLHEDDFSENKKLADFTGIQIFNKIKEFNPGIQIIIFTASSNSLLLDELYSYDSSILGYVKKEHPKNYNLTTQGNINKLINLINNGFRKKYLKNIFNIKTKIEYILSNDIFNQYMDDLGRYESFWIQLQKESKNIFDILDSESENKFIYAMISIASSLETILSIFIIENRSGNTFWDGKECYDTTLNAKLKTLFNDRLGYPKNNIAGFPNRDLDMKKLIKERNNYLHSNAAVSVNSDQILSYYNKLLKMIQTIQNPPNYRS